MFKRLLQPHLRPWLWSLGGFYLSWLAIIIWGDYWAALIEHWGIAAAMAAGSYAAGSTPMGGGTVGFPVLVLLFNQSPELGRDFSFAVQSIGMTSASIFILCRRQPIEWPLLRPALLGSLIGTPLGIFFVAPHIPGLLLKLSFAVMWASFGILHLYRTREFAAAEGHAIDSPKFDRLVGFTLGLVAGMTVVASIGVGIDMMLYALLVLLCRADLRIAVPTSVLAMSFNSLLGILVKNLSGGLQEGVFENWLAAAPIVILGAPIGSWVVSHMGRAPTLYVVASLCLLQFFWTLSREWHLLGPFEFTAVFAGLLLFNLSFEVLHRWGLSRAVRHGRVPLAPALDG